MTNVGQTYVDDAARREHARLVPRRRASRSLWRTLCADVSIVATFVAVLVLFAVSPVTLEAFGIQYIVSTGGVLAKLHPATFIACAALAARILAARHPVQCGWHLFTNDTGVVLLLMVILISLAFGIGASATPLTPVIDTFLLPIVFFILLRDLDAEILKWLAVLLLAILCANAAIAIYEFLRGVHIVHIEAAPGTSYDPTRGDTVFDWRSALAEDWRATALFGHPLSNGVITGCAILCLVAPGSHWLPRVVRLVMPVVLLASMFSFGARTALVLSVVFGAVLVLQGAVEALGRGSRLKPRDIAFGLLVVALAIAALAVLLQTGFFDKTLERFTQDEGSASTRVTMFSLFEPLTWQAIFLGPDQDLVETLQRMYGLEFGIESSWVGLVLTYGVVVTSMIMIALAAFSWSVIKTCGRGATLVLLSYMILVSVSASLSGKTITLAMAVILALVFLRKDERRRPLWPTTRVSLV